MCIFTMSVLQRAGQPAHAVGSMLSPHQLTLGRAPPLHSRSRRQQVHCTAIVVQEQAQARHVHEKAPKHWQRSGSMSQGASLAATASGPASGPQQTPSTIEVHLEVQYSCQFGQHVSIVGTFQGWHVPAAVPMTWSQGDAWNVVLPVPVGTDIEYKYLVMWDDGSVARWQEGPNNSLSVQHAGVLMHVQDTWSHQERSVREVGPRLTHNQQQKQSGGHSSGPASPKGAAAAAAAAFAAPSPSAAAVPGTLSGSATFDGTADSPASIQLSSSSTLPSGSSSRLFAQEQQGPQVPAAAHLAASSGFASVLPVQPTWAAAVHQPGVLFSVLDQAAAEDDDLHLYEDEEEDVHWPADMLQKAAAMRPAAAAAAGAGSATSTPARTQHAGAGSSGKLPAKQQPVRAAPRAAATPTATILAAAAAKSGPQKQEQQQQAAAAAAKSEQPKQQQQPVAAAAENLAQLLPMLRTELETALTELLKHPEALHEHSSLLEEGQTVLSALQHQLADSKAASTQRSSSAATAAAATSSSRSSGRSPSLTLTSGDEIAAALLSDDCEEACFCMVDAICSCADWDFDCSCEEDPDTPCELPEDEEDLEDVPSVQQQQQQRHSTPAHLHSAAQEPTTPAGHTGTSLSSMDMDSSYGGSSALSVGELARAAAVAALRDPAVLAARAAAFTDVQAAMEKSAELLQALSDPCHPLMLEADRNLATASRQLHAGHLLR